MITAHAEHAFRPRPGDMVTPGREHAVLDQPLTAGRFTRQAGDALCKPAQKFWGLSRDVSSTVNCPECLAKAQRYGVILP